MPNESRTHPTKTPGLYRVDPSRNFPEGAWEIRMRLAPRRHHRKTFRTRSAALAYANSMRDQKQRGDLIDPAKSATLFEQVADEWEMTVTRNRKEKTALGYQSLLRTHVRPTFDDMKVGAIDYGDVERWIDDLTKSGLRAGTVRNAYRVLKMILDFAMKNRRIRANPCVGVTLPRIENQEMKTLTAEQVATLVEVVGPPNDVVVRFAAYTGLRAGEIAALRVRDLDLKAGTVTVRRSLADLNGRLVETEPKTKAARRTVGIPRFVLEPLKDTSASEHSIPRREFFIGTRRGGDWRHGNFYARVFRPAVKELVEKQRWPEGLGGLRFHDLRHTYASFLVEQGAHPKEMSERLGHSSVQVTLDRYSHICRTSKRS